MGSMDAFGGDNYKTPQTYEEFKSLVEQTLSDLFSDGKLKLAVVDDFDQYSGVSSFTIDVKMGDTVVYSSVPFDYKSIEGYE